MSEENADAVAILTVHKAKGLEREIVLLCALDGGKRYEPGGFRLLAQEERGYGLQVRKGEHNALFEALAAEDRAHLEAEKLRLLYVALTRARRELILVHTPEAAAEEAKNPWLRALRLGWGYGGGAPAVDGVEFDSWRPAELAPEPAAAGGATVDEAAAAVARLAALDSAAAPRHGWPSALGHDGQADFLPGADEGGAPLARAVGRCAHRAFELWNYGAWAALLAPLRQLAAEEAAAAEVAAEAVERRAHALLRALADTPCGVHLRRLAAYPRWTEVPLLHAREGITYSGAIDLLYREPDGGYVVADFKTDAGLAPEAARARYGEQLRLYGAAVAAALALPAPPRLELLLLDRGLVAEVAPA